MASSNHWMSHDSDSMETYEDSNLQQRLGLYQVFCRLYEHHRELLDEILSLEAHSSEALSNVRFPFVQGVMVDKPHLITNLLQGKTQALFQPENQWRIGRHPQRATLPIADQRLSRVHAAIEYVAQKGFYLTDLSSTNGTFVNGEPLRQPVLLKDGDRIRLGSISFIFLLCASAKVLKSASGSSDRLSSIVHSPFSITTAAAFTSDEMRAEMDNPPSNNPLEETFSFIR